MTSPIGRLTVVATALLVASTGMIAAGTTTGPNGETAVPASSVTLTPEEEEQIKAGGYTAHTKIVTLDLSELLALDMVNDGSVVAIVADEAYAIGQTLARAAAAAVIGKDLEPFYAVDALAVTKDNVKEGWFQSLRRDPPATLTGG